MIGTVGCGGINVCWFTHFHIKIIYWIKNYHIWIRISWLCIYSFKIHLLIFHEIRFDKLTWNQTISYILIIREQRRDTYLLFSMAHRLNVFLKAVHFCVSRINFIHWLSIRNNNWFTCSAAVAAAYQQICSAPSKSWSIDFCWCWWNYYILYTILLLAYYYYLEFE